MAQSLLIISLHTLMCLESKKGGFFSFKPNAVIIHLLFSLQYFLRVALHTGTETGFTGFGFNVVALSTLHWTGSCALTRNTVTQHAQHTALMRIQAVWRQSGISVWIPDPHRIQIKGPVWRPPCDQTYITYSRFRTHSVPIPSSHLPHLLTSPHPLPSHQPTRQLTHLILSIAYRIFACLQTLHI